MSGTIYIIENNNRLIKMKQTAYAREADFQQLLENFPELLAGEQINSAEPRRWLLISREVPIPSERDGDERWYLDHLFLDQDAVPTLVEVKRKSDTRLRREVIGQILDYAANAVAYWPDNEMYKQFAATCERIGSDPEEELSARLGNDLNFESFWETADFNLKQGKVRLVFVADSIPSELQRVIEFLNERMSPTEVLGVEIRQYVGEGFSTHIPRVIGQTGEAQLKKRTQGSNSLRRTWDKQSFFEDMQRRVGEDELTKEQVNLVRQLYEFSDRTTKIKWGTGAARGSFNPYFANVSKRAPFTVWSDGTLYVKLSWLVDQPSAEKFRQIYETELKQQNIPVCE